jgi:hypothetical protein
MKWFNAAARHHSWAVEELNSARSTSSELAYLDLVVIVEEAKNYCISAKDELDAHIADHQC